MQSNTFKQLVEKRIESYKGKLFGDKEIEYARNDDRLHNFKVAARMDNETPERSLWGMWKKHIVSIKDMIDDLGKVTETEIQCVYPKVYPKDESITEKFDDMHNYLHLLEALIQERKSRLL